MAEVFEGITSSPLSNRVAMNIVLLSQLTIGERGIGNLLSDDSGRAGPWVDDEMDASPYGVTMRQD